MCDPLTIAAVAATVAGTAYNSNQQAANQKRMVQARNDATNAELTRQKAFQQESEASMNATRKPFEGQEQMRALAENVQQRQTASDAAVNNAPTYDAPTSRSAPKVVSDEVSRRTGEGSTSACPSRTRPYRSGWRPISATSASFDAPTSRQSVTMVG